MSDQNDPNMISEQDSQKGVGVHKIYLKDCSFESPSSPGVFSVEKWDPKLNLQVDTMVRPGNEDRHEVILKITANANSPQGAVFLVELEYAGVFQIQGAPQELLHPILLTECPRQLFPFARRVVADVTKDGGFPPLMLEIVDFMQIYRAELAKRQAAQAGGAPTGQAPSAAPSRS